MNCPSCLREIFDEAMFCHHCGSRLDEQASEPTPMERFQSAIPSEVSEDEQERELWQGSFSKLAMTSSWIAAAGISLVLFVVGVIAAFTGFGWAIAVGLILLIWVALILRLLYLQLSRHYYLSNQRFVHEQGLLWREIDRVEAIDIDDVSYVQGPVERLLGVGTVKIVSSDQTHPNIDLPGIENVRAVASLIDETRRQERRKRGLYVESV